MELDELLKLFEEGGVFIEESVEELEEVEEEKANLES